MRGLKKHQRKYGCSGFKEKDPIPITPVALALHEKFIFEESCKPELKKREIKRIEKHQAKLNRER